MLNTESSFSDTSASESATRDVTNTATPSDTELFETKSLLTFNDMDSVLDMGTNKEQEVEAPKTIERLEQISEVNMQRRKEEEEEEDEEEDDNLEIFDDNNIKLDIDDVGELSNSIKLDTPILLGDIELLD